MNVRYYKLLFWKNLSAQMLLDTVTASQFALDGLVYLFTQADMQLEIPQVDNTKDMFG